MSDVAEGTILFIALLALLLVALIIYLTALLIRVETMLWRLTRYLRPGIERDSYGRPLKERV